MTQRPAYAHLSLPRPRRPEAESRLRRSLAEFAAVQGLDMASVFVDECDEQPHGLLALRELLRRTNVHAVVLPGLAHVQHIAAVAALTRSGPARCLNAAVLLAAPHAPDPAIAARQVRQTTIAP